MIFLVLSWNHKKAVEKIYRKYNRYQAIQLITKSYYIYPTINNKKIHYKKKIF